MSFADAVETLPPAIRLWVLWLTVWMVLAPLAMMAWRETRVPGRVTLGVNLAVAASMHLLYEHVGFVRLLGVVHLVFWTPLAVWLAMRLGRPFLPALPKIAGLVFLVSITVSLAFDAVDVARYALGERAPITDATP